MQPDPGFNPDRLLRCADEGEAERGYESAGGDAYQEIQRWRETAMRPLMALWPDRRVGRDVSREPVRTPHRRPVANRLSGGNAQPEALKNC